MAVKSLGKTRGLTVLNNTDGGVNLPVNAEEVIKRQVALEEFIKNFVKLGGKGKLQRDGKVYYSIFGKADLEREITVTSDGKVVTAGMYGAEALTSGVPNKGSTFGYVAPTTVKVYEDFVELEGGKFMKEIITKREQEQENLPTLVADRISTYQSGNEENIIHSIKLAMVAAIGTTGKAATDAGWTATDARQIDKTYTIDEAGGLALYNDIDSSLGSLLNIGRKGSTEEDYPFARGRNAADVTLGISRDNNRALTIAFKESPSGAFPGMTVDQTSGQVTSLFGTKVVILESMPQKAGADFNWILITTGQNGAIAMPSVFDLGFVVRPHYEGVSTLADIVEGQGGSWGIKFFQPELIYGSFKVVTNPIAPTSIDLSKFKGDVMTLTTAQRKDLKAILKLAASASNADLQAAVDSK